MGWLVCRRSVFALGVLAPACSGDAVIPSDGGTSTSSETATSEAVTSTSTDPGASSGGAASVDGSGSDSSTTASVDPCTTCEGEPWCCYDCDDLVVSCNGKDCLEYVGCSDLCTRLPDAGATCIEQIDDCDTVAAGYRETFDFAGFWCEDASQCGVIPGHYASTGLGECWISQSVEQSHGVLDSLDSLAARWVELDCPGATMKCAEPPAPACEDDGTGVSRCAL